VVVDLTMMLTKQSGQNILTGLLTLLLLPSLLPSLESWNEDTQHSEDMYVCVTDGKLLYRAVTETYS